MSLRQALLCCPGNRSPLALLLTILFMLGCQSAQAVDCAVLIDSAEADWHSGNVAAVVDKLQPEEAGCASNTRFNRVLGEALLASGHPVEALMPLERAVMLAPEDKASWRALSQTWLLLGGGREAVLAARGAMRGSQGRAMPDKRFHWQITVEGSRGHDSNATLATAQTGIVVPALGDAIVTLSPSSRQSGANYWGEAIRGEALWMVSPTLQMALSGTDSRRKYQDLHVATSEEQTLTAKIDHLTALGDWSLGAQASQLAQDSQMVRTALGGNLGWRPLHASWFVPTLAFDATNYRYKGGKQAADGFAERVLSASYSVPVGQNTFGWTLLAGHDAATVRRADGDRNILGARLYATGPLTKNTEWFSWLDHIDSRYRTPNTAFLLYRHDSLTNLSSGVSWTIQPGLSLRGQLSLARQRSNIALYDYRRADFNLTLSYLFGG